MKERIEKLQEDIAALQETIDNFEIDPDEYENEYRNMLDELYPVEIGGIAFSAANVLEDQDPTAYQTGLNDYGDTLNIDDDPEYQRLSEALESLELELEDLVLESY